MRNKTHAQQLHDLCWRQFHAKPDLLQFNEGTDRTPIWASQYLVNGRLLPAQPVRIVGASQQVAKQAAAELVINELNPTPVAPPAQMPVPAPPPFLAAVPGPSIVFLVYSFSL